MPKVLDYTGLQIYNEKIKSYIYPEVDTLEDLNTIKFETYKDKKSIRIYCKEDNSLYKIKLNEDGSIIDNNGFYEFEKISEGKDIQFYDTHKDLPSNASKDDLAYVRGTSIKSLINVDRVAEIVNGHSDIYLHLNDELILHAGVLSESTVIYITNSDSSIMYYYLGSSGVINELKNTNPDFFVGLSPKVGDWLIKLNNEFKIEKDFTIPFDEEKVKEQISEEETKQLKSELFPPEKSSGYSGLFVYNGTSWVMNSGSVEGKNVILTKADGTEKSLQNIYDDNEFGRSGLPEPESKDKLLISVENAETSELEWSQVDKDTVGSSPFIGTKAEWDALSESEQDKYSIVNITDDEATLQGPPELITSQVQTGPGYSKGNIVVQKLGHFVQLDLRSVVTTGLEKDIYTGLPKPSNVAPYFLVQGDGDPHILGLGNLRADGTLWSGTSQAGMAAGVVWDGTIMYFTND